MARSFQFYGDWAQYHGRKVMIDGLAYTLKVNTYMASYPRREMLISVYAEPVNKHSKHYLETKRQLGDDWSTDVLESFDVMCDILAQLQNQDTYREANINGI